VGEDLMRRKTIFISAYRNVSVRYILYSDIFEKLRESKDLRIVLFLKDNDVEYYRKKLGGDNILFESVLYEQTYHLLRRNILSVFLGLVRYCMTGGKNPTDDIRSCMYKKEFSGSSGHKAFFWTAQAISAAGRRASFFRKLILAVETFLFPGKMYDIYFEKYNPDMLVTSSVGNMIDPYFMRCAKRHRCKVVSIIHNWDNASSKGYRGADPDAVITWNNIMKREVSVFLDIPKEKILVGGIAHWDFYFNGSFKPRSKKEFLDSYGLSEEKWTIFYGTSVCTIFRNTFDVVEQLLCKMEKDSFLSGAQLLVRLHHSYFAKQKGREGLVLERYKQRMDEVNRKYGDMVVFNLPKFTVLNDDFEMPWEEMNVLAEILKYSDVMLTEYSTLMIEGCIFDLPVINVGFYDYSNTGKPASYYETATHIKQVTESGATKTAHTMEQLCEYVRWYLEDPCQDKELRKKLVDKIIDTCPASAGNHITEHIQDLL